MRSARAFCVALVLLPLLANTAAAQVKTEDAKHPCMKNLPAGFTIHKEEWYTWDKNPRNSVHVLASVNESSYVPGSTIKMGDHPVVWTNEHVRARNIYIFMGHGPDLLENKIPDFYKF